MKRRQLRATQGFHVALANSRGQAAAMNLAPGDAEGGSDNAHRGADQWLYVISGRGTARVNGRRVALEPGTLLLIERQDKHEIRNSGRQRLRTLNIYVPPAYTSDGEELPAGRA